MPRGETLMKRRNRADPHKRVDHSLAWWSALLLAALLVVLTALFLSGRLLLNLDTQGLDGASTPSGSPLHVAFVLRASDGSSSAAYW